MRNLRKNILRDGRPLTFGWLQMELTVCSSALLEVLVGVVGFTSEGGLVTAADVLAELRVQVRGLTDLAVPLLGDGI